MKEIRTLKAEEIDCRAQTVKANGCSLLLYKDARCDMSILDELCGAENWQRKHYECKGNLFCSVGIKVNNEWVWKDDCGAESYTEKEKGEASDSFKRACVNWGIGRELYTSPFIWITLEDKDISKNGERYNLKTKFSVKRIECNEHKQITRLVIADDKGRERYWFWADKTKPLLTETSLDAAKMQDNIMQRLAQKEEELGEKFSIDDIIDTAYRTTGDVIEKIKKLYEQYKQTA